jgi:PilZ domain
MDEHRKAKRMRMLKSGKILLGSHAVPCTVRNLSDAGACLEVQTTVGIPSMFEFVMPSQPPRTCKVVWLGETRMGVHFQISAVPTGEEKL